MIRRIHALILPAVGLAGLGVGVLPSGASQHHDTPAASFTAVDYAFLADGGSGSTVTIPVGGTVSFAYPTGNSAHNVDFGTSQAPSSCVQTGGTPNGAVPPLPHSPSAPGWSGSCQFDTPGTYTFKCDLHPYMTGTIVVGGGGATTTSTNPPTTTPAGGPYGTPVAGTQPGGTGTTPAGGPAPATPAGKLLAGGSARGVRVASRKRGSAVRVEFDLAHAGAGSAVTISLSARGVRGTLGHASHRNLTAGIHRYLVRLSPRATALISKSHRLTVRVMIVIAHGSQRLILRRSVRLLPRRR